MTLAGDVKAVEQKVVGGLETAGKDILKEIEAAFTSEGAKHFEQAAASLLATEAGKIVKIAVEAAKTALPNGAGSALHAIAAAFSASALEQAGIAVGGQVLNLLIETVLSGTAIGA